MQFVSQIKSFLISSGISFEETGSLLTSDFPVFQITEQKLLLHCIPVSLVLESMPSRYYFSALNELAAGKGLRIVHLWEDIWLNNQVVAASRLQALAGQTQRIHARQTSLLRLNKLQADEFLKANHLQGSTAAYFKYGLLFRDELVALITFSKSRVMYDGPVYYRSFEMERYASKAGVTVVGGLSKLLQHFTDIHKPAHLMTYADRDWGEGQSYAKLGFKDAGCTDPLPFYLDAGRKIRFLPGHMPDDDTGSLLLFNSGSRKWVLDRRNSG